MTEAANVQAFRRLFVRPASYVTPLDECLAAFGIHGEDDDE